MLLYTATRRRVRRHSAPFQSTTEKGKINRTFQGFTDGMNGTSLLVVF